MFLSDLWPTANEIKETIASSIAQDMFRSTYADVFTGDDDWRELPVPEGELFAWEPDSTYVRLPPYFADMPSRRARSTTSRALPRPARRLRHDRPHLPRRLDQAGLAGRPLPHRARGRAEGLQLLRLAPRQPRGDGARHVRERAASNLLVPGSEGTWTVHVPSGEELTIYEASQRYLAEGTPTIVLAGKEYGSGSSRDWAAKGPNLLGVRR